MITDKELFLLAKNYWAEKAGVLGSITPGQFDDIILNKSVVADLLDGYKLTSDSIILDFGCGEGRLIPYIAPNVKLYVGLDISKTCLKTARLNVKGYDNVRLVELTNLETMAEDLYRDVDLELSSVDLVISWTVFQHTPHMVLKNQLHQLAAGLKSGAYLHAQIDWPKFGLPREIRWRFDQIPYDVTGCRWWPNWVMWQMLESCGFTVYKMPTETSECWRATRT